MSKRKIKPVKIYQTEYSEKKSKFISYLIPLDGFDTVNTIKREIKGINHRARHFPYAYIFKEHRKFSDDGEPCGSAGQPILSLLEMNKFSDSLLMICRYYGGIKLGKSNLTRAFSKAAKLVISEASYIYEIRACSFRTEISYRNYKHFKKIISTFHIYSLKEFYTEIIEVIFEIDKEQENELLTKVNQISNIFKFEKIKEENKFLPNPFVTDK